VAGQRQSAAAAAAIPSGFAQSSPGTLVLFVLITSLAAGEALVEEREIGTLRRLVTAPIPRWAIIAGKLLGAFTLTLVQMAFLILIGQLVFRVNWGRDPVALALVVVAYALVAASFGLMVATMVRTVQQFVAMQAIVPMIMAGLGGAMWPLEIVPPAMRAFGHLVPTAWAMQGLEDIITRGLGVQAVLLPVAALLLFAAGFFVVGVRRFRFE
jgi:ABC-2 type transport system permease protein